MNNRNVYLAHLKLPDAVNSGNFHSLCMNLGQLNSDSITICVKKQENMSKWLHECDKNEDEFEIKGPYVFCIENMY